MASKILVDELAPYSHATDVTLATGKKIVGANTQFKITGGSNLNHLQTDGAGNVTWVAPPVDTTGFSQAQQWRLSSNFSSTTSELYFYANWEKPASTEFPGVIATDMAPIPSARSVMAVNDTTSATLSGAWTFPVTGTWFIRFFWSQTGVSGTSNYNTKLWATQNNGSNWVKAAETNQCGHHNNKSSGAVEYIFNVADVATDKVRFSASTSAYTVTVYSDADANITGATFFRLGDES